jgi:hypothetical protein
VISSSRNNQQLESFRRRSLTAPSTTNGNNTKEILAQEGWRQTGDAPRIMIGTYGL